MVTVTTKTLLLAIALQLVEAQQEFYPVKHIDHDDDEGHELDWEVEQEEEEHWRSLRKSINPNQRGWFHMRN